MKGRQFPEQRRPADAQLACEVLPGAGGLHTPVPVPVSYTHLGPRSSFSPELESLRSSADRLLPGFAGANGRYRLVKGLELGGRCAGVLTMAPRHENTATILEMTGVLDSVPHFHLAMDYDWDENAWSRLNSFLYYLSK